MTLLFALKSLLLFFLCFAQFGQRIVPWPRTHSLFLGESLRGGCVAGEDADKPETRRSLGSGREPWYLPVKLIILYVLSGARCCSLMVVTVHRTESEDT